MNRSRFRFPVVVVLGMLATASTVTTGCSSWNLRGVADPPSSLSILARQARQDTPPTDVESYSSQAQEIERDLGAK
ncbi:hypothetical protein [Thermostilla marina]